MIKYQKLLITVCISMLVVFSVGSLFIHNEQQVVAQTSIGINSTDLDSHGDLMNIYNNTNYGVSIKYSKNLTEAPSLIVKTLNDALNQNTSQLLSNPEVRFIAFFVPTNASFSNTSKAFIGLAVSNVSKYNSTSTIPVVSQYLSEVKKTINNTGLATNQAVNVEEIKVSVDGKEAEGLEYILGNPTNPTNQTKTLNIPILSSDRAKIVIFTYSSSAEDYEKNKPTIESMIDSIIIR